MTMEKQETR